MNRCLLLVLMLLFTLTLSVSAATDIEELYGEQLEASGAQQLTQQLPADTQELLDSLDVDLRDPTAFTRLSTDSVLTMITDLLRTRYSVPLQAVVSLMAVVILSAVCSGFESMAHCLPLRQTYQSVAALAAAGMLMVPLSALLQQVWRAIDSVTVFMYSYVPVYAAVMSASGSMTAALSYQTALFTCTQLLVTAIRTVVIPLLNVSLAIGCTGAVTEELRLDAVSALLHKVILWGMGLFSTLFTWVLSMQQMAAASADTLGSRTIKFSLSSFVPVVGGVLSEAYSTVIGCAGLLRSGVGCFGILSALLIVLPPLISCIVWNLCLHLGGHTAALFRLAPLEKLCKATGGAVRVLLAVLALFALLMIVSTTVVVFVGRGA